MRVLWRVATLALALLAATVSGEHSAASVDTVILHVAADSTVNQTIVDQIMLEASRMAAVWTMRPPSGRECHEKEQLTEKKATGLIHITDLDGTCMQAVGNPRRLHLIYNRGNKTLTTETGDVLTVGDPTFIKALDKVVRLVVTDARKHAFKETKQPTSAVAVPIWSVIVLGVLVGVLLAANCIFFNKLRAIQTKPNPADDKKAKDAARDSTRTSLKQRKAAERKKSAASSSSKSSKKSSKDKRKKEEDSSCRSSKSLSTKSCKNTAPTSVKVVSVGSPAAQQKKLEHAARPLGAATDEVATVMALRGSSLPARTMDRVRGTGSLPVQPPPPKTATAPPPCWSTSGPAPTTVTRQPGPLGPSIVPKVSVIGHPSPFAVLAAATSPLPPASTPAIVGSAPTAYSSPSSAVAPPPPPTVAPSAPPPTAVVVVQSQSPPSPVSPSPPKVVPSPTAAPPPAAPPRATVAANGPSAAAVAPIPLTLVGTSSGLPSSDNSPPPQGTVAPTPAATTPVQVKRVPISPAYSLASTPRSASPSSSCEKAPTSKRSGKK